MFRRPYYLRALLVAGGFVHLAIGLFGTLLPRWFFELAPPWPPLHVGQVQIGGIFDLALATLFLTAATDVARFAPLAILTGIVAEWGHALVRIGHVVAGDNPPSDLFLLIAMLLFGALLLLAGLSTVATGPDQPPDAQFSDQSHEPGLRRRSS